MRTDIRGDAIIIGAALVYGTGLVAQSSGNSMGPWSFASAGFLLGAAALFPVMLYHRIKKSTAERAKDRSIREMAPGALAVAAVLVICVITQQYGLIYTSVGKAGFITSLYVIEVPIAGLFLFKRRLSWRIWIAAAISMTGLYFVSITEGIESVNSGDVLLLITSFSYVAYMYQMEHYAKDSDPLTFTLLTTFFTGLMCLPCAVVFEDCTYDMLKEAIVPVLYAGIVIHAVGYTLQMTGQKYVPAERATVLLSMESLFSLFAGMIILDESLSLREYFGCALIFVAVMLAVTNKSEKDSGSTDSLRER